MTRDADCTSKPELPLTNSTNSTDPSTPALNPSQRQSSGPPKGAIAGGVVGGIAALSLVIALIYGLFAMRRKRRGKHEHEHLDPQQEIGHRASFSELPAGSKMGELGGKESRPRQPPTFLAELPTEQHHELRA